jgi:hypothetical protein
VLLILLAVEGFTILRIGRLLTLHFAGQWHPGGGFPEVRIQP